MKNKLDILFFNPLFVSERKQIVLLRHEKLFEFSRAVLCDKSLRNGGNTIMRRIENQIYDEERAWYGCDNVELVNCRFDGPADGESA